MEKPGAETDAGLEMHAGTNQAESFAKTSSETSKFE